VTLWLVASFLVGAVEVVEAQQPKKKAADRVSLEKRRAFAGRSRWHSSGPARARL